ncbi:MAR1 protein, partial [Oxyruncus cristatus]|nr:MAR1 protein [Oxyruncus cristatus]
MRRRNDHPYSNYFRGKGHTYFAAEEALGIGLFILALATLLAFGCWYYKRRSGYKSLRVSMAAHFLACCYFDIVSTVQNRVGEGAILDYKMTLQEYRNFHSVV